jgi:prepilin-type N-terminal cleavage/methylation domain-containing protein
MTFSWPNSLSKKSFGFTFIEVLVVVVLVGVLATIGIVSYSSSAKTTRDARRKKELANVQVALEAYRQSNSVYPVSCSGGTAVGNSASCADWIPALTPDFIPTLGPDPSQDSRGIGYRYQRTSSTTYLLIATLENTDDPDINGPSYSQGTYDYVLVAPQ